MSAFPFLYKPVRTKDTESGRGPFYEFAITSCQGWRNTQEDVHLLLPNFEPHCSLFAVFDGHNGIEVAEYAAKHLPSHILANAKYRAGQVVDGLQGAFLSLDDSIKKASNELSTIRAKKMPQHCMFAEPGVTSGCTAVVCLLHRSTFYCANLGDSRCVLDRNGKALPLSHDHTPEQPTEADRILKAGGIVRDGRINSVINVSRAFGDHCFKDNAKLGTTEQMISPLPDVAEERFNPTTDRLLVLMCDGIWNSMDNDQVVQFVEERLAKGVVLSSITEQMIDAILPDELLVSTGIKGKDNMTIMLVKFSQSQVLTEQ